MKFTLALSLLLALCAGCVAPKRPTLPPLPPEPPTMQRAFKASADAVESASVIEPPGFYYWDHDGAGTPGYVFEGSTNLFDFYLIGVVPVTDVWRTNGGYLHLTYRYPSPPKDKPAEFYRIGAILGAETPLPVAPTNFASFPSASAPVEFQPWTITDGTSGGDSAEAIGTDSAGNIFVAANWQTVVGGGNMRLSKYSPTGSALWHKVIFGTLSPHGLVCDANGNVFVAGEYLGQQNLGGTNLPGYISVTAYAAFVASYDGNTGAHRWSIGLPGSFSTGNAAKSVALGPDGHPVITGYCGQMTFIGGATIGTPNGSSAFYAKFNGANGSHISSRAFPGFGVGFGVAVDNQNRIAITGRFHSAIDFGGGLLTEASKYAGFVASFSSAGSHRWSHKFGAWQTLNGFNYGGLAVSTAPNDDISLSGSFYGSMSIAGGPPIMSEPRIDMFPYSFAARLSANGVHLWSIATGLGEGVATASDLSENSWFAGVGYLPGSSVPSSYLLGYDANGDLMMQAFYACTSIPGQRALGVAISKNQPVISGKFSGTANFTEPRTAVGGTDLYLLKP